MVTKSTRKSPVSVQAVEVAAVEAVVMAGKPTAAERLAQVLYLLDKSPAKPDAVSTVKFGKAVGFAGGGSVYVNRGNVDVRSSQKQVAEWAKAIPGSTVRGPQGQYLRITF